MIINKLNAAIINTKEIYIHDDVLLDLSYNRLNYKLSLLLSTKEDNTYTIEFNGVIGFEMSSCDFWGASPRVYDIVLLNREEYIIIPKLMCNKHFSQTIISSEIDDYIEIELIFISGDKLVIASKHIEYNKRQGTVLCLDE